MGKEYINKTHQTDNCPSCGVESEEYNVCPEGCYNYCTDVDYHGGDSCDQSC